MRRRAISALLLAAGGAYALLRVRRAQTAARAGGPGTVIITGGTRGLGLQLVRVYHEAGWRVAICGRDETQLAVVQAEFGPERLLAVAADVTRPEDCGRFVQATVQAFGRPNVLIHNAGAFVYGPWTHHWWDDYQQMIQTNYYGTIAMITAALPELHPGGQVVTILSASALLPVPRMAAYRAAKSAADRYVESLQLEGEPGVRFLTVYPSFMRTSIAENATYRGEQPPAEYAQVTRLMNLPFITARPARAARQIFQAQREGRSSLILPAPVAIGVALARFAPQTARRITRWVARRYLAS